MWYGFWVSFDSFFDSAERVAKGTGRGMILAVHILRAFLVGVWGLVTFGMLGFFALGFIGMPFVGDDGMEAFAQTAGSTLGVWFIFSLLTLCPAAFLYGLSEKD